MQHALNTVTHNAMRSTWPYSTVTNELVIPYFDCHCILFVLIVCITVQYASVQFSTLSLLKQKPMEKPLSPRESGQFVAERSRDVFVDEDGVKRVAQMIYDLRESEEFTASGWKKMNPLAPPPDSDEAINWVFVTDTMNFSFWPEREEEQCEVVCRGSTYRGYMSLCAAVTRAMDEGDWISVSDLHRCPFHLIRTLFLSWQLSEGLAW